MPGELGELTESSPKVENYPPDLKGAIFEARRMGRVEPTDARLTGRLIEAGYRHAEDLILEDPQKNAEWWVTYYAVKGKISEVGDFLELARTKPDVGGNISPQRAFAFLAAAYENRVRLSSYGTLGLPADLGIPVSRQEQNEALDRRNELMQQVEEYGQKAGAEYQRVQEAINSPKFKSFEPRVGYFFTI